MDDDTKHLTHVLGYIVLLTSQDHEAHLGEEETPVTIVLRGASLSWSLVNLPRE